MRLADTLETMGIHSVAGLTGARTTWGATRPCRAPHHTISDVGLIGGGHTPTPGGVSLAHQGVPCLDGLPECRRHGLEVLRQPLEESVIYIQSLGRPRSQCFRSLSRTAHDLKGLGLSTIAIHHHRDGYHASSVSPPPLGSEGSACFSLDT
jgi:hypothetical protein